MGRPPLRTKTCAICELPWQTRIASARTCSPLCRARLREIEHPTPGKPPRDYPPDIIATVADLYSGGMTVAEVQAVMPGYRVQTIIERYGIPTRAAIPRDQTGTRNGCWRGDDAGYQALHLRVENARGKPARCERCQLDDPTRRYNWANLTGRYHDVDDYERMCCPCHTAYDTARRALTGARTSPRQGARR